MGAAIKEKVWADKTKTKSILFIFGAVDGEVKGTSSCLA
jgi:hypothetical protein